MKKIDKAVEIVRGWSDEELKEIIFKSYLNPCRFYEISNCTASNEECMRKTPEDCWNEEVEE